MNRFAKILAGIALGLAAVWLAGWVWFASIIPSGVTDAVTHTDAIVVLTGGSGRVEAGLALLQGRLADKLFISGAGGRVSIADLVPDEIEVASDIETAISLGRDATDTPGNAMETASWVRREQIRSIRLVTAGYHMPRSLLEFAAVLPDTMIVPHPVFSERVKTDWWRWPGTAKLIAREYTKYLLTWLRIRLDAAVRAL